MLKKNILVTGGCGFIGSNFVNKLLNFKHNIISRLALEADKSNTFIMSY